MQAITVNELQKLCNELIENGKGEKKIMMSADDEGNEYHELFFGFTENVADVFSGCYAPFMPYGVSERNLNDYVILG